MRLAQALACVAVAALSVLHVRVTSSNSNLAQRSEEATFSAASELIATLQKGANLGRVADLLQGMPDVMAQIIDSPGPKTFLAPTDDAVTTLMTNHQDTAGRNVSDIGAVLLYHVLNGTYDWTQVEQHPMHTVGHSLLTLKKFVFLPGGNGQAVVMTTAGDSHSDDDDDNDDKETDNDAASTANIQIGSAAAPIQLLTNSPLSTGNIAIIPAQGVMSLPSNATETMRIMHATAWRDFNFFAPQVLNCERGSTAFVPTDDAVAAFNASHHGINLTHPDMHDMVMNHIIDRRVLYSTLLRDQGSLISANGMDMTYDRKANTIQVGNSKTAKIVQYDVVQKGGVIHMIDAVLDTSQSDAVRADRAAQSAGLAGNSYVAGPVTSTNCASTQGKDVPPSPPFEGDAKDMPTLVANSTLDTFDVTQSGDQVNAILGASGVDVPPKGGVTRGHIIQTNLPDVHRASSSSAPPAHSAGIAIIVFSIILTTLLCTLDCVPFLVPLTTAY